MVKSKKMSKTSIAVIVLALLLVLSLVMGMTGAWFTAKTDNGEGISIQFGVISMDAEGSEVAFKRGNAALAPDEDYLMPGDKVNVELSVENTGYEAVYYAVNLEINGTAADVDPHWYVVVSGELVELTTSNIQTLDAEDTLEIDASILLDGDLVYGNEYQDTTVTVAYEVRFLQTTNLDATDDAAKIVAILTGDSTNDYDYTGAWIEEDDLLPGVGTEVIPVGPVTPGE